MIVSFTLFCASNSTGFRESILLQLTLASANLSIDSQRVIFERTDPNYLAEQVN